MGNETISPLRRHFSLRKFFEIGYSRSRIFTKIGCGQATTLLGHPRLRDFEIHRLTFENECTQISYEILIFQRFSKWIFVTIVTFSYRNASKTGRDHRTTILNHPTLRDFEIHRLSSENECTQMSYAGMTLFRGTRIVLRTECFRVFYR